MRKNVICNSSVTIFTIATGEYIKFYSNLYQDLVNCSLYIRNLEIILLTDQEFKPENPTHLGQISFKKIFIQYPNWETATLSRYEALNDFAIAITSQKVFWIDADMRILNFKAFSKEVDSANCLTFARHPGYLTSLRKIFFRMLRAVNEHGLLQIRKILTECQLYEGTWDDNKNSTAFTHPSKRKKYVHGAFWGGPTADVLEMSRELDSRVKIDLKSNYVALWHDESHLNQYCSTLEGTKYFSRYFSGADKLSDPHLSVIWSIQK